MSVPVTYWSTLGMLNWFLFLYQNSYPDYNGLHQKLKYNVCIPCVFLALDIFSYCILYTAGREVLELEGLGLGSVCLPSVSWSYIDSLVTSAGLQVTRWRNLICPLVLFFFSLGFWWEENNNEKSFIISQKAIIMFLFSYDHMHYSGRDRRVFAP